MSTPFNPSGKDKLPFPASPEITEELDLNALRSQLDKVPPAVKAPVLTLNEAGLQPPSVGFMRRHKKMIGLGAATAAAAMAVGGIVGTSSGSTNSKKNQPAVLSNTNKAKPTETLPTVPNTQPQALHLSHNLESVLSISALSADLDSDGSSGNFQWGTTAGPNNGLAQANFDPPGQGYANLWITNGTNEATIEISKLVELDSNYISDLINEGIMQPIRVDGYRGAWPGNDGTGDLDVQVGTDALAIEVNAPSGKQDSIASEIAKTILQEAIQK
jgi:hypothetical protein